MRAGQHEAVVSIIIPCLDEAAAIGSLVRGLLAVGIDEALVVDGGSSDGTPEVAAAAGARVIVEPRRGYGRACAAGVAAARDDATVLAFIDGDGSDDPASALFDEQRLRFDRVLTDLQTLGARPRFRHAANSAAVVRDPRVWFERVRPGLLLYGIVPPPLTSTIPLTPVMTLTSRITAVKGMRAGEVTGYGARFTATKPMTIAIVPAGYADGLDLRLAGRGCVLIRGRRAPIIGSVCMDMIMIDVTGLDASPGDEVVFIGHQDGDTIDAREMAATIGSIPWEIVCRVGTRIDRIYT